MVLVYTSGSPTENNKRDLHATKYDDMSTCVWMCMQYTICITCIWMREHRDYKNLKSKIDIRKTKIGYSLILWEMAKSKIDFFLEP